MHLSIWWLGSWWYLQNSCDLEPLGSGLGGGQGSSGRICPSSLSFSSNWLIGMWSSLNFLRGLELIVDDVWGTKHWFPPYWVGAFSKIKPSSFFNMPLLIASSTWVPTTTNALKFGKYWAKRCLWNMGNKFFTTIWIFSSSLGLMIIWATLALHLVMKAEKDSFGYCLVVFKSLLVTSISMLCLYRLWKSRQMSTQLLALASSRLRNHLRAALVKPFWNI